METDRSIRWKRSSNPLVYHDIDAFRSKVELRQRLTKFKFQAKRYQTIAHQTEKTMIKPIIQLLLVAQSCYYNYVFVSKKKFMIQHLACCSECKNVCTADVENGLQPQCLFDFTRTTLRFNERRLCQLNSGKKMQIATLTIRIGTRAHQIQKQVL